MLPTAQVVAQSAFDPFDRLITTLISGLQQPGTHIILFDAAVTNGVCSFRLVIAESLQGLMVKGIWLEKKRIMESLKR